MRRSIRKRLSTSEPTKALDIRRRSCLSCACGGQNATFAAAIDAATPRRSYSPGQPTSLESHSWRSPPAARPRDAGRAEHAAPNASRSCCGGRWRSAAALIVLILIVLGVKGCLDARANRALSDYARNVTQIVEETEQTSKAFFGKLSDPGETLGYRVRRRGQRRPQRDGQLLNPGRRPQRPRRHGQCPERARTGLRAARRRDGRNRRQNEHRAGRRRLPEGDRRRSPTRCRSCSPPTSSTQPWCGPKSTACSPPTGSKAATCRRASSSRKGPSGSTKPRSARRWARSAARPAARPHPESTASA